VTDSLLKTIAQPETGSILLMLLIIALVIGIERGRRR
jgi:hypothetical protein